MSEWEKIISFESLYKAHRRARLCKRHKKEVIEFEMHLGENLWKLHNDLKYGKYAVGGYHNFMIYDPKEREIQAITYRDRIVQHSICDNYLMPLLDRRLIYDNCACRKEKGSHFALARLRSFMTAHYKKNGKQGYFIKVDIKKYFNSIDHDILKRKVFEIVLDEDIYNLLCKIIDSYEFEKGKGLPMGNQTSQCFALLYLDKVDRYIKEKLRIKHYVRYMDDMIMLVSNKAKAKNFLNDIQNEIALESLRLNEKSQIIETAQGIKFLGWSLRFGKNGEIIQIITNDSKRRIITKVKSKRHYYSLGRLSKAHISDSKVSYMGSLSYGNSWRFMKRVAGLLSI